MTSSLGTSAFSVELERLPLREPFTISRRTFYDSLTATVTVFGNRGQIGRGECEPHEFDEASALRLIADTGLMPGVRTVPTWAAGITRARLLDRLPRSPMRNAIDCALWDAEAKGRGVRASELAETSWAPVQVMPTLGIHAPLAMAAEAEAHRSAQWLKVKVGSADGQDAERIEAVAAAVPGVSLLLDANAGWSPQTLASILPLCTRLGVRVIEQPLDPSLNSEMPPPRGDLMFCADESCLDRSSLPDVLGRFQCINIKLDKTGGLTEALALRQEAERKGLAVMVGMMSGSSRAVAPASLLAQGLELVDLELGFLVEDREPAMRINGWNLQPPEPALWG